MAVAISKASLRMDGEEVEVGHSRRRLGSSVPGPTNPMVSPLLSDLYQFTMAYAYWKAGKHDERAVFDLFFRKNPFGGEHTIFGGLEECIRFVANFKLEEEEISFLRSAMPTCEDAFFDYLKDIIDCSDVEVYAIPEASVVFPKIPLMRVEGPVAVVQLLETPFVNLVNYASLVTTNAARHRFVAGRSKLLLEFGLRRAQGPDGGISASKYSYMGGFDATSNVAAGRLFGIPLRGTHSHAFVSSFLVAEDFVAHIVKLHGIPQSIVSDRDAIFTSTFWKELFKLQRVQLRFNSAYHPQSDGQTEVVNKCLETYLRCFCNEQQKQWLKWLPWAEFYYNTSLHSATGFSPYATGFSPRFYLMFRVLPKSKRWLPIYSVGTNFLFN